MAFLDAFALAPAFEDPSGAAKEEVFVDVEQFVLPEGFFVEDIGGEELDCYAASKVFDTFTSEASFYGSKFCGNQLAVLETPVSKHYLPP